MKLTTTRSALYSLDFMMDCDREAVAEVCQAPEAKFMELTSQGFNDAADSAEVLAVKYAEIAEILREAADQKAAP